jgi:membrane-associated phospholipid phosphatase
VSDQPAVTHQPGRTARSARRSGSAALLGIICLAGLVVVSWLALYTADGQRFDERAMLAVSQDRGRVSYRLVGLLHHVSVGWAAVILAAILIIALARGRIRGAVAAAILVAGANITTEVLKKVILDRPDLRHGRPSFPVENSLPSGHTTVAFSLALAAVLVIPHALRWVVAFAGSAVATLLGCATVVGNWHRPSDVVAGILVALIWAALVSAFVAGPPRGRRPRPGGGFFLAVLGSVLAGAVVLWGAHWMPGEQELLLATVAVLVGVGAFGTGSYARLVSATSD